MSREDLINEVRALRARLLDEAGGSIHALCERLRVLEAQSKERVIQPPPRSRGEVA